MGLERNQVVVSALRELITKRRDLVYPKVDLVHVQLFKASQVAFEEENAEHGH